MNERQLIRRLARRSKVSEATAADSLDQVVHGILTRLKQKQPAHIPGVATLVPHADGSVAALPAKPHLERDDARS